MRLPAFSFLTAVLAICPVSVLAGESTSGYPTCVTITETTGSACPTLSGVCVRPACIELLTVTQECGCASIYSTTICETECAHGCGTSYSTVYIPCATSVSSPPPVTTTTSTSTSSYPTSSPTSTLPSSTIYPNSTMTSTSTTIVTISSCPASVSCTGQTTTWTGTSGPSTCPHQYVLLVRSSRRRKYADRGRRHCHDAWQDGPDSYS